MLRWCRLPCAALLVTMVRCGQVSLPLAVSPTFEDSFYGYMEDSTYFVSVKVGSPPQMFQLGIDSGSAAIWLAESDTYQPSAVATGLASTFDPKSSSTYVDLNSTAHLIYGTGEVDGAWGADAVTIGGLSVANQALVAANHVIHMHADGSGMIGFSPDAALRQWGECSGTAVNIVPCANVTTFARGLLDAGSLDRSIVAFALDVITSCSSSAVDQFSCTAHSRSTVGGAGSITIGGLAAGTRDSDYMWMPRSDDKYWVAAFNMTFAGRNATSPVMHQRRVLFDTGTTGVLLSLSTLEKMVESWSLKSFNTSTARFNCMPNMDRQNMSLDLNVDQVKISIPLDYFIVCSDDCSASGSFCHLLGFGFTDHERDILHNPEFGNYDAIFGVPFLRALKAFAFDYDGHGRIGIVAPDPITSAAFANTLLRAKKALLMVLAWNLVLSGIQ